MKIVERSICIVLLFLLLPIQAQEGGQFQDPAALLPKKRTGTHCTGSWVGLETDIDGCVKARPHRDSIPAPSIQ